MGRIFDDKLQINFLAELLKRPPFSVTIGWGLDFMKHDTSTSAQAIELPSPIYTTIMASSNCLRSLARPTSQLSSPLVVRLAAPSAAAAFSTTSTRSMPPPKLSAKQMNTKTKGSKTLRIKKKAFVKTGKPPAVGERKALRKRIIVSNTNALEVIGMRDLDTQMVEEMSAVQPEEAQTVQSLLPVSATGRPGHALVGKVVGLQGATVDSLRAVDAFKTTQGWGIFRRPGVLVREENVVLTRKLVDAQAKKETVRLVIDGEKGTGKSLMMLHAMSTAFVKGWIVLNIPEGMCFANIERSWS